MKRLMFATLAAVAAGLCASAAESPDEVESESTSPFRIWGFGNYGMYSGYQLYGSLLNSEPTLQGYAEVNASVTVNEIDLGYVGVGLWSNTDLTDKRRDSYGKAFNEWDPNVHYGFRYYFDDGNKWALDYRTSFVWYYYPHRRHDHMRGSTATTMDWNHSFALLNPYVTPFFDWVHEYHENKANLWQFGLKRECKFDDSGCDALRNLTLTPSATFVVRSRRYNWCFPTAGFTEFHNGGLATMKLMLEANYKVNDNFGLFAKVAYCRILDNELRDAADHGSGADYGQYKDFAWGGVGVTFNF